MKKDEDVCRELTPSPGRDEFMRRVRLGVPVGRAMTTEEQIWMALSDDNKMRAAHALLEAIRREAQIAAAQAGRSR